MRKAGQFTCIEFALFTLGVLFAYIIIGYKKHYDVRPGPYIVSALAHSPS